MQIFPNKLQPGRVWVELAGGDTLQATGTKSYQLTWLMLWKLAIFRRTLQQKPLFHKLVGILIWNFHFFPEHKHFMTIQSWFCYFELFRVYSFSPSSWIHCGLLITSFCFHSSQRSWFGHFVVETFQCDFVEMKHLKYIDTNKQTQPLLGI